ncbi:hypothetical protein OIV83_005320 [Microbotryomycetes sp. JL201]|nr:hypothetical protein OIV83_005320 [Microbotryomycetes sp. JL201]
MFPPLDPTLHDVLTSHVLGSPNLNYPTPRTLYAMEMGQNIVNSEAYRYTTQQSASSLDHQASMAIGSGDADSERSRLVGRFDSDPIVKQDATKTVYEKSPEPPIQNRMRRVVQTLYGTSMGTLAGPATLSESAGKARELQDGMKQAREAMQEAVRQQEEEQKGFETAWQESDESEAGQR